jgi:hypothetical protein
MRAGWLLALALLVALQSVLGFSPDGPFASGALWGPDEYMRLVRIERLLDTRLWFDGSIPRANAPDGEVLHWTRPLDLLILAGAAPLAPLLGGREALELSGVLVSPLLQIAALAALLWAARPLLAAPARFCLGVLFVCQPAVLVYFGVGRPDHHGLLLLGFIGLLGCLLRALDRPENRAAVWLGGLIAAGSLWVSVEALLPLGAALAILAVAWIARGGDHARSGAALASAAAAGALLAVVVERPWPWLEIEYDRISLVHPGVLALCAALCAALARFDGSGSKRALAAAAAALAGLAAVALACPKFLGGPLVDADPWIRAEWDPKLLENWPLFDRGGAVLSLAVFLLSLGLAVAALPWLLRLLAEPGKRRVAWAPIAALLLVFLPLAMAHQRWAAYAAVLLALPYADLGGRLLDRMTAASGRAATLAVSAARGAVAVGLATVFSLAAGAAYGVASEQLGRSDVKDCPVTALARHLAQAPELQDRPRRILACGFHGPELLYRTRHEVIATP